jgi:hypothetical protein
MRFVRELDTRRGRLALTGLAAGFVIYAALALSGALGGGAGKAKLEQDLTDARLMATMAPVIADAHTAFQGDAGMEGSPLPGALVERLKESYTLAGEEREDDKTRLSAASVTALAAKMSIDTGSAEFIVSAKDATDWDTLAGLNRNLFDENRATLQALIYAEVSKVAAESGIGKLDSVKVEAPRLVRGRAARKPKAKRPKADANSVRELKSHMDRANGALGAADVDALGDALDATVSLAEIDPSVRLAARADLVGLLDTESLSGEQAARIRLAALGSQPDVNRAVRQILGAHLREALASIPQPSQPASDDEESEGGADGSDVDADADETDGESVEGDAVARDDAQDSRDGAGGSGSEADEDAAANNVAAPSDADAAGTTELANGDPVDADSEADATADADATAEEAAVAEADEEPEYTDAPVAFHAPPFPALPELPASTQRRLLTALIESGGMLRDEQINAVLAPPEPPAPDEETEGNADEDGDVDGEGATDEDGAADGDADADEAGDADGDASAGADGDTDRGADAEDATGDAQPDDDPASKEDGDGAAEDASESQDVGEPGDGDSADPVDGPDDGPKNAPELAPAHPDAPTVRAYQVALVDALWQVAELLRRRPATVGETYTASVSFKAPLDQLVNFVHKLEAQKPWIRVTELRVGIDNADQPMLGLTLSLEANIL